MPSADKIGAFMKRLHEEVQRSLESFCSDQYQTSLGLWRLHTPMLHLCNSEQGGYRQLICNSYFIFKYTSIKKFVNNLPAIYVFFESLYTFTH